MRHRPQFLVAPILALAALAPACGLADESAPVAPRPCQVEGIADRVLCATYPVWENRTATAGRRIPLHVVILPALEAENKVADPIYYFAGGPGEGATRTAAGWAGAKALRGKRDVVLIDQRGTGTSNALECRFYGDPPDLRRVASQFLPIAEVERCRDELAKRADLTQYTTEISVDDFDEVRAWLGHDKINIFGGSYGTEAAQVYLRRHRESVRTLVLDGVAPVDEPFPLHHAMAGQKAADLLFAECAADATCKAAFPSPGKELATIMRQVDKGVEVEVEDPRTQAKIKVHPDRGVIADGIRFYLYGEEDGGKNTLPLRIHRAIAGDRAPFVAVALRNRLMLDEILAEGLWLSVTCAEDLHRIDPGIVARETAGTFLGDFRVRTQKAACAVWPRGTVSASHGELVRSDVPALLISGERDPVTPPSFGERVAKGLPNALHLIVPHGGHGAEGECMDGITVAFVDRASTKGLDVSCLGQGKPATFATELPVAAPMTP